MDEKGLISRETLVAVLACIAIAALGCATPKVDANATGSGVRADVQLCFDDSSLGKNFDKYTGGLLNKLMGCPEVE